MVITALGLLLGGMSIPCMPPGWSDGDPIVSDNAAPCMQDERFRADIIRRAENGEAASAMLLATYLWVDQRNFDGGIKWARIAAASGEPRYLYTLASWLGDQQSPQPGHLSEARRAAEEAAGLGHARAALLAGDLWFRAPASWEAAKRAYSKAVRLGTQDAMLRLSSLELSIESTGDGLAKAAGWLTCYLEAGAPNDYMKQRISAELGLLRAHVADSQMKLIEEVAKQCATLWGAELRSNQ